MVNNNIVEERVNYSVACALKKAGFERISTNYWFQTLDGDIIHSSEKRDCAEHDRGKVYCWQPTLDFAIEWLRVNYSIHIWVSYDGVEYTYNIRSAKGEITTLSFFTSSEEAKKAALGYVSFWFLL